ncbi:15378_t:CDS:2 [Acaulospora colombiana]|uniref:15378_t:CDS:1 n=1 Tax=Acaulospora colombiana TaxID=27376 RepID=A0ACA9MBH5_9GLOM|nr:15378_t:CDS:2 [Acaulospora colombiana]
MGKTQKKRAMRRHNPVRVPDSHLQHGLATAAASTPANKKEALIPVIEKLSSSDVQERIWACAAISNLIQNDSSTRRLLQGKNIVGALIARLKDDSEEVIVEAAGSLRIQGSSTSLLRTPSPYSGVYRKHLIPPCLFMSTELGPRETSSKALNAVNQLHLIPFLMAFLDSQAHDKLPAQMTLTVSLAQCLYVLTEENFPAIDELRTNATYVHCLLGLARGDGKFRSDSSERSTEDAQKMLSVRLLSLRTLVCGILRNILPLPSLMQASTIDIDRTVILPFLLPILPPNLMDHVTQVQSLLVLQENEAIGKQQPILKNGAKSDHRTHAEVELDRIESELRVLRMAIELVTGICAELPEPDDDADVISDEEDDEEEEWEDDESDVAMEEDDAASGVAASPVDETNLPAGSSTSFDLVSSIVPPCLAYIQPTPFSYPPSFQPSPHPPTTSALQAIHIAALECLNNACLSIAQQDLHSSNATNQTFAGLMKAVWDEVWKMLAILGVPEASGLSAGPRQKLDVWNISLGVLWSVARIRRGDADLVPEEEKVRVLVEMCRSSQEDDVKVMCLGILECLATNPNPSFVAANQVISEFILGFLPAPGQGQNKHLSSPEVMIQAASAMIDIFSDEESPWDLNFRRGKWEFTLKNAIPGIRKGVRSIDRRKEGGAQLRDRGDEVLENMVAFVKYRRNLKL